MTKTERKFGCQTYTWEMLGSGWNGGPDALIAAVADGGYTGIEITNTMIGDYAARPDDFARALDGAGLTLVSFAFGSDSGFTLPVRSGEDLDAVRRWVDFVARFPGALVSLGSATSVSDGPRDDGFGVAAEIYNRASEIGRGAGVVVAVHPSSHHRTLLSTRSDYDEIFSRLDPEVGWVPDTGHILRGGQTMADTLAAHHDRIRYVHLKDVDAAGDWAMLGAGVCDIAEVIAIVAKAPNFNGWIVVEEESDAAGKDPAGAVRANRETLSRMGFDDARTGAGS
ncbi:myo-inositol catabolism protein [Rhizobium sp. Leaf371]|uniref:sugar phosphate isomerase/epimerase family protein n=1 Tax=Rhizobium sp. Leaf371 TaxID=1736355 RepID=UPI0007162985|nr:sugar phosphate isomerase/epimerase [Rhizobium sp. Leaf371]KQS71625.1 myo-inositol catabolism protein [Rhizobium sp. Leaf371]